MRNIRNPADRLSAPIDPAPIARHLAAMERTAVRLIIEGRVQGVGYRWWAVGEARRLGLDGWVRNRSDGTVELLAAGPASAIDQMEQACRHGPTGAVVTAIDRQASEDDGGSGFDQKPTLRL